MQLGDKFMIFLRERGIKRTITRVWSAVAGGGAASQHGASRTALFLHGRSVFLSAQRQSTEFQCRKI